MTEPVLLWPENALGAYLRQWAKTGVSVAVCLPVTATTRVSHCSTGRPGMPNAWALVGPDGETLACGVGGAMTGAAPRV